jgi:hypothetical protein
MPYAVMLLLLLPWLPSSCTRAPDSVLRSMNASSAPSLLTSDEASDEASPPAGSSPMAAEWGSGGL